MSNLKVYAKTIEDEALEQINTLLSQDAFKDCKVRIMPDVHAGKGCVIGFTADLGNKVIPNIVGVDIGCGMLCVSLGHRDFNAVTLNTLDRVIRTYVPSGKNVHDGRQMRFEELKELYCYRELKDTKRLERSIGTLGGGNHFIKVLSLPSTEKRFLSLSICVMGVFSELAREMRIGTVLRRMELDGLCHE